jgi:hypothetical protein
MSNMRLTEKSRTRQERGLAAKDVVTDRLRKFSNPGSFGGSGLWWFCVL